MKKKTVNSDPLAGGSEQTLKPEYVSGTWKGIEHYRCELCNYDSFHEKAVLEHLVSRHNSEAALERLVELEKSMTPPPALTPSAADAAPPPIAPQLEEGSEDVFEVELKEVGSTVDAQGNEQKTFTIKE